MKRVVSFIDGFNLYHSIREAGFNHLKWLNYWSLSQAFVNPKTEQLKKVFYFTAFASWDMEKVERHKLYINALLNAGVDVIYGKFKRVTKNCLADCKKQYLTFEEKETDINIAVTMLLEAFKNTFDKALLFSGDSDMIAGVRAVKNIAPHKHIKAIIPYGRSSIDLSNNCDSAAKIKKINLERNQFPDVILLPDGGQLKKPASWV